MSPRLNTLILPWLTAALGLVLTASAWHWARVREEREIAAGFQREADQLGRGAAWGINLFTEVLQSLGSLHALSDRVSAYDFEEFARKGLTHQKSVLGPFGFAQWIPAALRPALEEPGPDGQPLRRLTEFDPAQGVRPAGERSDYFPLTYQHPESGLGLPNSFDLGTLPESAAAIQRMAASSTPTLGPRTLTQIRHPTSENPPSPDSGEPASGYFVYAPILNADATLSGFTVAVLWPQSLLRRALDRVMTKGIQITLFDPKAGIPPVDPAAAWRREEMLSLVDQPWVLRCEAMPTYVEAHATPLPWLAVFSGLVVTLLLAGQTRILVQRAARIEATVRERTAELQEANQRLAGEMKERVRLELELDEVADREKRRIGHDLHDSLGQKLAGAVYVSKALSASLGPEDAEARESAEKINEILKDAVAEVRRTARGLAPIEVGEEGLAQALHRLAEDACSVYGIACSFRAEGELRLRDARMAAQLYHIAQEALTNGVRHGGAREVSILLSSNAEGGRLSVCDNGQGFDPSATRFEGAGLRIMRHRSQTIGGQLTVESTPGAGTTVNCRFPV